VTVTSVTLHDPDTGLTSQVWPRLGVAYQGYTVQGTPRAVTESRTGADGTLDSSAALDDAAISLSLRLYATPNALLDEFGAFLHPAMRPVLIVTDTEWPQARQLVVRSDVNTTPRELSVGITRNVQYQWRGVNGIWEQAGDPVQFSVPLTIPATDGIHIDATAGLHVSSAGLDMHSTTDVGEVQFTNPGNVRVGWQAFLYGPATGPKLGNDTAGAVLAFGDDVTLQAGDYLWIDSGGQALINSDPGGNVLTSIDWDVSSWWLLQPGVNQLRYYSTSGQGGAQAFGYCRPGWYPQ
jgi:hypothetical protein